MANFLGLITIDPKRSIETIQAHVTLEEVATDELQITEHPVELGANINDHAFLRPAEVVIRCGWANASLDGFVGALKGIGSAFKGGNLVGSDYVSSVYHQLLALQASRVPFDVCTGKRTYKNMLLRSMNMTTDPKTEYSLMVTASCRQVLITNTRMTTLPRRDLQAAPKSTGEIIPTGDKNVIIGIPAPGGWQPPNGGVNA
ncbi:phage baseplate protein [Pseudomonas sp. NPDC098747]|uniref:phage baseplate protein n=1 Tax=Pseudomonas sp. NPDC098747 TaxID=3364487 RepID=UPI00383B27D7